MFNLEQSIGEWRRQMRSAELGRPALEELENHLREEVRALVSKGESEGRAFEIAASRLGSPESVGAEFKKTEHGRNWPLIIGVSLWVGAIIWQAALLAEHLFYGRFGLLLWAHVISLTGGYEAGFVAGVFACCHVYYETFQPLSSSRQRALRRGVSFFMAWSAILAAVGMLLGMIWSREHQGQYWKGSAAEIGGLGGTAWLVGLWAVLRFAHLRDRAVMLTSIGGAMIVSFAWFGPFMARSHQIAPYWPLAAFLAINLFFLWLGMTPAREVTEV